MQIKVFKAGNMKDAMTAMKAELGDEAVILHSKKYKEGGLLGIGSREVVEITAAIEETSLPKKSEPPPLKHPTVAPSSVLSRYKTDGTEQAIQNLEADIQDEKPTPLIDEPPEKKSRSFEEALQLINEAQELEETAPVEKISSPVEETAPAEKISSPVEEAAPAEKISSPVEEAAPAEKFSSSVEETAPAEKISSPVEETAPAEKISSSVEETAPAEKISSSVEETAPAEKISSSVEETAPAEKISSSVEETAPAEKISSPVEETAPAQQNALFTQEQLAQTQAMIMAQFNQMQMMQQAAIAQAQMQVQMQTPQPAPEPSTQNEEKIKRLEAEIAQMKALLTEVLGRDPKKGVVTLHEAMKLQEVDEDILTEMATQSNAGDTLVDVHTPTAKSTLINYLNEHVKFSDGVKLNRHGVRIVALLGTTGVGKTTTLAKIAAKFVLEQRTNVALITADTYRISAVEQLKTYSDILELPLEIVYNPAELSSALERYRDKELILIDTAGRSQHNEYQMRELEEFLRVNPRIEKHLVISATTKLTDARQIMNKFSQVNPDRIIFTKTDETGSLGMIINLLRDSKYSLSYITTGQSVPDDIERANADILTNLLLKKVDEM